MSVDTRDVLEDLLKHASRFSESEGLLVMSVSSDYDYPICKPVCRIEEPLAYAAHDYYFTRLQYNVDVWNLPPQILRARLRRPIDAISEMIETRVRRWGWDYILTHDGMDRIGERLKSYEETKYHPFLDAFLSSHLEQNTTPDEIPAWLEDEAERCGVSPTMTPEDGARVLPERKRNWWMTPALAGAIPSVSTEEHQRFLRSIREMERLVQRLSRRDEPVEQHDRDEPRQASQPDENKGKVKGADRATPTRLVDQTEPLLGSVPPGDVGSAKTRLQAVTDDENPYFLLDGKPIPCKSEVMVHFVAELIEANGRNVAFSSWLKRHPEFEECRSNRGMSKLPKEILPFIDHGQGKAFRLNLEALAKPPGKVW
jgi:hypothetical protein